MKTINFSNWLQVGANIGILVGLVLVGFQMRQNSHLLEIQLLQQDADQYLNTLWASAGDDYPSAWEKQFVDPENLTLSEMRTLEAAYWGAVSRWLNQYRLYERGLLSAGDWKSTVSADAPAILKHRYGLSWWKEIKKGPFFPDELITEVDTALADESRKGMMDFYQRIKTNLRATKTN